MRSTSICVWSALLVACGGDGVSGTRRIPASIELLGDSVASAPVGGEIGLSARVESSDGLPVSGVVVTFKAAVGSGRVDPVADTTDAGGAVSTRLTLGTTPGINTVTAVAPGLEPVSGSVTGEVGATTVVDLSSRLVRFTASRTSATITGVARDAFANRTNETVVWAVRDSTLVTVAPDTGFVDRVRMEILRRPGRTYVVATGGSVSDSTLVSVQDGASTPCAFVTDAQTLQTGQSLVVEDGLACIAAPNSDAEYALIGHYNTAVFRAAARLQVTASGVVPPITAFPEAAPPAIATASATQSDIAFESALRERERREIRPRVAGAREWFKSKRPAEPRTTATGTGPLALRSFVIPPGVAVGDRVTVNVNANDFCADPDERTARVVAVTTGAVVLADELNPPGGFSDAEYREFGVLLDTLIVPVDTAAFGSPSDIDGNGKVGILFTSAVNKLTQQGAGGVVLGFYYVRDLLPKASLFGDCPGSNEAEMFYIMVPDPDGTINSNPRTKTFVANIVGGTIGHEYQHLINASRRMYVIDAPTVDEEVWLNEGLSHIAEELLFYRVSGRGPRQNIDGSELQVGSTMRASFDTYQRGNFGRYREFLQQPEGNMPISQNDALATRGAAWSFLRYLADRVRPQDGDFWHRLVNSGLQGVPNLDAVLNGTGLNTLAALQDWSMSLLLDDLASPSDSSLQQGSWRFLSALPATGFGNPYPLVPRTLQDGESETAVLLAGASTYMRFAVQQGEEALLVATGSGGRLPTVGMRISIVRTK